MGWGGVNVGRAGRGCVELRRETLDRHAAGRLPC